MGGGSTSLTLNSLFRSVSLVINHHFFDGDEMARERTTEEILDEVVYAANRAMYHYGPSLSEEGLATLREAISAAVGPFWCDSAWRVDLLDGEEKDFHELLPAADWADDFATQAKASRGG